MVALRQFMTERQLTQVELARRLGMSESMIARVLSGERSASGGFGRRFIETFGLDTYRQVFHYANETQPAELAA